MTKKQAGVIALKEESVALAAALNSRGGEED